jgi:Polysaccharide deacetylase
MRKVIITFDDGFAAQYRIAMPILKKYKHSATFFVCGAFIEHPKLGHLFMDWEHVANLDIDGFEIGSHLYYHDALTDDSIPHQMNFTKLNEILLRIRVAKPISMSYPGFYVNNQAIREVRKGGFLYARAGCEKTNDFLSFQSGGSGPHHDPFYDNPYNINCSGVFGDNFGYDDFVKTLENVKDNEIPIYCFHSFHHYDLPEASMTSISIDDFEKCMKYLSDNKFKGIAMRDLSEIR